MSNAYKAAVKVSPIEFYADGSGAPATVECGGYIFACDFLGSVRITLIRPAAGSRRENRVAAQRCEQAYLAAVTANSPAGWVETNVALYA